jgi:hypothetical protein
MNSAPVIPAPPINLNELDPFYLSFLKEQCRGYSLKEGSPEFNQCLLKQANANRDVNMYKYSDQYKKDVAKAMSSVQQQATQNNASQATQHNTVSASTIPPANVSTATIATMQTSDLMRGVKECDELQSAPMVRDKVIGKLLVANEQSDNKLDLLANHNKITNEQKPLVKAFAKEHYACFKHLEKQISSVAEANIVSDYMNSTDEVLAQFYSGDTTVAQTNSAFLKVKAIRDNALARLH